MKSISELSNKKKMLVLGLLCSILLSLFGLINHIKNPDNHIVIIVCHGIKYNLSGDNITNQIKEICRIVTIEPNLTPISFNMYKNEKNKKHIQNIS